MVKIQTTLPYLLILERNRKMRKYTIWGTLIFICVLIVVIILQIKFDDTTNFYQELRVKELPCSVILGPDDMPVFVYTNGNAELIKMANKEIEYKSIASDVSVIDYDEMSQLFSILNDSNLFYFQGDNLTKVKEAFAKTINLKAQKHDVLDIKCGRGFSAVLFSDGSVFSDINYVDVANTTCDEFNFEVLKNITATQIAVYEYGVVAVEQNNKIHAYSVIPNNKCFYHEYFVPEKVVDIACHYNGLIVLTEKGNVFVSTEDMVYGPKQVVCSKIEELCNIVGINVGFNDGVVLALREDGTLFHWGISYIKAKNKSISEITEPDIVFDSEDIIKFVGIKPGILIIEKDGSTSLIVN